MYACVYVCILVHVHVMFVCARAYVYICADVECVEAVYMYGCIVVQ